MKGKRHFRDGILVGIGICIITYKYGIIDDLREVVLFLSFTVLGSMFPDVDLRAKEGIHRCWLTHTLLIPVVLYYLLPPEKRLISIALGLGMVTHIILDIYKLNLRGTAYPSRPNVFGIGKHIFWALTVITGFIFICMLAIFFEVKHPLCFTVVSTVGIIIEKVIGYVKFISEFF